MQEVQCKITMSKYNGATKMVPLYELPILQAMLSGEAGVEVVGDPVDVPFPTIKDDEGNETVASAEEFAAEAYQRMVNKYAHSKDGGKALAAVYRTDAEFISKFLDAEESPKPAKKAKAAK